MLLFLFTDLRSQMRCTKKAYVSNNADERMSHNTWQNVWVGLIKALRNGTNAVGITEEADVSQKIHWNLRVL